MDEITVVQVLIRGEGAGLAAAALAGRLQAMSDGNALWLRYILNMEYGRVDTRQLIVEISTRAPRPEEIH
jgi:hypothetical protein